MSRKEIFWLVVILLAFIVAPADMTLLVQHIFHAIGVIVATMHWH